jgi:hypothetical protein
LSNRSLPNSLVSVNSRSVKSGTLFLRMLPSEPVTSSSRQPGPLQVRQVRRLERHLARRAESRTRETRRFHQTSLALMEIGSAGIARRYYHPRICRHIRFKDLFRRCFVERSDIRKQVIFTLMRQIDDRNTIFQYRDERAHAKPCFSHFSTNK